MLVAHAPKHHKRRASLNAFEHRRPLSNGVGAEERVNNTKQEAIAEAPAEVAIRDEIDAIEDRTATYKKSERGAIRHCRSDLSRQIAQPQTPGG